MAERERVGFDWNYLEVAEDKIDALQKALNIHPLLCKILVQKGVDTFEKAKQFFRPSLIDLHDPFLMKDMDIAVNRIVEAISNNQKILIYGDYDVDGTTSVTLVYSFLLQFYKNLDFYIPDRHSEGYGISEKGIDYAIENKIPLVIALDCGIRAHIPVARAKENNIDFIICDHHTPAESLPPAVAILDPKRIDCTYPNDELPGCGIGFKLCQGYALQNDLADEHLMPFLDLVAIGIACDIVPIIGENRVLASFGLKVLNENPSPGVANMISQLKFDKDYSISDVVFKIGPMINAAGRMGHAKDAVNVLLCEKEVGELHTTNTARQEVDRNITEAALVMLESDSSNMERSSTVVYDSSWHKGVVGIVASRLIEFYYRPTVVFSEANGYLTGSARSVDGFNVYEALSACSDLFIKFGGHAYAAGMTMELDKFEQFKERFDKEVKARILPYQLKPQIEVNTLISIPDVSNAWMKIHQQMAPFGPSNSKPIVRINGLRNTGYSRIVGENHLKLDLKDDKGNKIKGIAFKMASKLQLFEQGAVDVVGTLEENHWNGRVTNEIMVKDIKLAEN